MFRAFLSYSSTNSSFVDPVAEELGRQYCVFDKWSFRNGLEFKESIVKGLDKSSIYVLFATRSALKSVWVQLEMDQAWARQLREQISRSVVYLLDGYMSHDDVPGWLRRGKISKAANPKVVAREIRQHIDDLRKARQHSFFVNRTRDLERYYELVAPIDGTKSPRALIVHGLPGIGRRSFIRKVAEDVLDLHRTAEIEVEEGDTLQDLAIRSSEKVKTHVSRAALKADIAAIKAKSDDEALETIIGFIKELVASGELPVLVDFGGIIDGFGRIAEPVARLLRRLSGELAYPIDSADRYG